MVFFALLLGAIVGFIVYGANMTSYKKAGAGQTYRMEGSTNVRFTRQLDNRGMSRSRVDHGFYSGSVSAAGRSEAYPMPQSIKNTIEQAQNAAQNGSAAASAQVRPKPAAPQSRPPRPNAGPAGTRPPRPGAPGSFNRKGK